MSPAKSESSDKAPAPASGQLIFYERPEPLSSELHAALRLKKEADYGFARNTNSVPIVISEFAAAGRSYPIVFANQAAMPLVVLGFKSTNLFVDDKSEWKQGAYIPAYIRRYPFVFITHPDGKQLLLGVDRAAKNLIEDGDGISLFEDGKPSELTQKALDFCKLFEADHANTVAFGQELEKHGLLVSNQAQAKLTDGRQMSLQGFRVVDQKKFLALPDAVVVDWHKRGLLALVYFHLASIERFSGISELEGAASK